MSSHLNNLYLPSEDIIKSTSLNHVLFLLTPPYSSPKKTFPNHPATLRWLWRTEAPAPERWKAEATRQKKDSFFGDEDPQDWHIYPTFTVPETNSLHLKMDDRKMNFPFGMAYFQGLCQLWGGYHKNQPNVGIPGSYNLVMVDFFLRPLKKLWLSFLWSFFSPEKLRNCLPPPLQAKTLRKSNIATP